MRGGPPPDRIRLQLGDASFGVRFALRAAAGECLNEAAFAGRERPPIEQVQKLGGKLVRAKAAVPKVAWYAVVEDPDGNIFAVWQADADAFPLPEPETWCRQPTKRGSMRNMQ